MANLTFATTGPYYAELKERVGAYFDETGLSRKGDWRIHLKTAIIFALIVCSYVWLVFYSESLWGVVVGCIALAQGFALLGFNIMHDGAHGAYSQSRRINWLMGFTLDLVGGSNKMWRTSHNVSHHMFTNVDGYDVDLFTNGLLRFSPVQPRSWFHRFQHLYIFVVYGVISLWWVTTRDIEYFVFKKGQGRSPATLSRSEATLLIATKLAYYSLMFVLPMTLHPVSHVLGAFLLMHLVMGLTLTTVFQLAHTTENVAFPEPNRDGKIEREWAAHQVETTADFAHGSRFATWYLGGLNYQIEHHLFSSISHIHYPAISKIVREVSAKHGVKYVCYPTFWSALVAHLRFIRTMGLPISASTPRTFEPVIPAVLPPMPTQDQAAKLTL